MLEKLQLKDEKNLLIQGLPSSIEKQFIKLSFSKNVTPLLRIRKIDFALIFAVNERQLNGILNDVLPALREKAKLWVAYPKKASKIVTDLDKESSWQVLFQSQFESIRHEPLDHVWIAVRFKKLDDNEEEENIEISKTIFNSGDANNAVYLEDRTINIPTELSVNFKQNKEALKAFEKLSYTNKKEYIEWIIGAKKEVTKQKRLKDSLDKLVSGKKNPSEK